MMKYSMSAQFVLVLVKCFSGFIIGSQIQILVIYLCWVCQDLICYCSDSSTYQLNSVIFPWFFLSFFRFQLFQPTTGSILYLLSPFLIMVILIGWRFALSQIGSFKAYWSIFLLLYLPRTSNSNKQYVAVIRKNIQILYCWSIIRNSQS